MAGTTAVTHASTREPAAEKKSPAHTTTRQASSAVFHAAGNLQLQGVLSGRELDVGNPDEPIQQKSSHRDAASEIPSDRARPSFDRNDRPPAAARGRDFSKAGLGLNLARAPTERALTPVQTKCAACEAEEASAEEQPVQLWDCSEFTEPTCVQTQEAAGESPVQTKCAACEAEEADGEKEAVQTQCAACEVEDTSAEQEPVQLWDCSEFTEPTCVQTKCAACEAEEQVQQEGVQTPARSAGLIHREARRGLSNATQPLPHADRIQAAFGHHDVSHVRSSVGGAAETSSRRMGALAFASGHRIAFRQTPDIHLAAHEAAHVVQQREGLSLPGNVGHAGDRWERHADRVADAVVGGRSAETLLDEVAKPGTSQQTAASGPVAQAQVVQHRFTSGATHLIEPPPRVPAMPTPSSESKGKEGAAGKAAGPAGGGEAGSALEAAKEGGEGETPPTGITVGGAAPAPGGGAGTPAAAGTPPPASAPAAPAAPGGGGGINAPCYKVDPPPRPENAQEPSKDERSGESQEEPRVTFDAWVQEPDQCPAEAAMTQGAQQVAGGMGSGATPAVGAAPAAGGAAPGAAATPPAATKSPEGGGAAAGGETRASAGAAKAEAEPGAEAAGAMSSSIGSAESGRDGAVIEYETAAGDLDAVLIRARNMEQGMTFAPGGEGAQRDKAVEQVQSFMRRAAEQIAGAVAFAREQVPARLGGLAEAAKANIQAAIESEKINISARIVQARLQAMIAAQMARAHVHAEYAGSVALIEAETTAAIAALDAQHTTSLDQVDQKETKGLEDVNSRFATGRKQHEDKGPEYSKRAIARGQEHAHQYERCKGDYSDDGFWDGCLTVRRAKAQQDAACKTAAGYKKTFLRTANKKGYDLKELRKQYRCAVIAGARQVNKTLDETRDKLVSGLESGRKQALEGLGFARTQNLAAIDKALAATLKALSAQEYAQRQAVNDAGYVNQLTIEQLAHASAANLARGISAAMDSLDQALAALRERIAGSEVPDPATLAQILANIETSLGGGMGTLLGTMETGAASAEGWIANSGSAALNGLSGLTAQNDELSAQSESGFAGQMSGLMAGASRAFGQLTKNHVQKAKQSATEGTTAMKKAVAGFDESLGTIGGKIDEALGESLKGLDKELSDKLAELDGQIAREAWKAAEKEQPAWKKVVAIVLIIVVIIAAAVISIVTLGAGASLFAVILVGALVGAVSAGLIQILNNWASGETWHHGLVQAMVMGAIGGAIGGGLGFAGGALAAGAAAAGARVVTQLAITVSADLLAEGITQTVGYFAFGQQFNWQGFVMAGAMSGVSFRAHPSVPHPPSPHAPTPHAPTPHAAAPHGETPHVAAPHAEAPPAAAPRAGVPEPPTAPRAPTPEAPTARPAAPERAAPRAVPPSPAAAGAAAARRAAVTQVAGGALVGLGVEYITSKISGEQFDPTRAASAAASAAVAARASRRAHVAAPIPEPTTRIGRAAERLRTFDPGGVGTRLEKRLQGLGGRVFGPRPESEIPGAARPRVEEGAGRPVEETGPTRPREEEVPTRPVEEAEAARTRPTGEPEVTRPREEAVETGTKPREEAPGTRPREEELPPGAPRTTHDVAQVVNERNVIVGKPLATEAEARSVLRSVMQGHPGALRPVGVGDVPEGFRPTSVEWGLGQLPDGRFVVIRGEAGAVDWSRFPGVRAVGHTHPSTNILHGGQGPASEMPFREALVSDVNRTALLPSGQDLAYVAREGLASHTVFTPFEFRGDGRIANAVPGSGLPRVEIEIRGARLEGHFGELPTYRAELVARSANGDILWQGTVYGMPHPYLGQIMDFHPPPGMRPVASEAATVTRTPPEGGGRTGMGRMGAGDPEAIKGLKAQAKANGVIKGDHEWAAFEHLHQQQGGDVRSTRFQGKKLIVEYADGSVLIASEIAHRVDFEFYRPGERLILQEEKGGGQRWMKVDENSAAVQLGETLRTQSSRTLPTYEGVPPSTLPEFLLNTRLGTEERSPLVLTARVTTSKHESQPLLAVVIKTGDPPTIVRHYPVESTHLGEFLGTDMSRIDPTRWEDLYTQSLRARDHEVGGRAVGEKLGPDEEVRLVPVVARSSGP